jgi:hypothetical protein
MDVGIGAAATGASRALFQLCGEVLLEPPPLRQPGIVRPGAAVGIELLDLLLNPDHVVRTTELLTLRNTLTMGRRVLLDISLDRLSRRDEERATQLSALISGRPQGLDERAPADDRLWLPLDTVPRPLSVPVLVSDGLGKPLTRPPQREVRLALEAALYQILRESLRAHPDFDAEESPVNTIMRQDDRARWLLQQALVAVCEVGPDTPRSSARDNAVDKCLPHLDVAGLDATARFVALDQLAHDVDDEHRRIALKVLRDALSANDAFLRLVDLVHRNDVVVASLDRKVRDQSVQYDLPDSEALRESVIQDRVERNRRMLDPREHNYTVQILVPLPENVPQYNLCVGASTGPDTEEGSEVSLIAAIRYDDHPGRGAIDAISACADELDRMFEGDPEPTGRGGSGAEDGTLLDPDPQVRKVRFISSRAKAALDRLERIVDLQDQAAHELSARWRRASTWTVQQSVSQLNGVTGTARRRIRTARGELESAPPTRVREQAGRAADALRGTAASMDHRLLGLQLASSEVPGQEVARLRINQARLASRFAPTPRYVEVWATVSDEAQPYFYNAVVQPLGLAVLVYLVGSLLFDTGRWPVHLTHGLSTAVLAGGPDAIVAVLLLIPAFALTRTGLPQRRSVAGVLRRPARLFVFGSVAMLCLTAIMVATQVGTQASDDHADAEDALHPHLLLWTFRVALFFFLAWTVWATVALLLRRRFVWRPKGLKSIFGAETFDRETGRLVPDGGLTRLRRFFAYDGKAPDAVFDLTLPSQSFPSHRRDP